VLWQTRTLTHSPFFLGAPSTRLSPSNWCSDRHVHSSPSITFVMCLTCQSHLHTSQLHSLCLQTSINQLILGFLQHVIATAMYIVHVHAINISCFFIWPISPQIKLYVRLGPIAHSKKNVWDFRCNTFMCQMPILSPTNNGKSQTNKHWRNFPSITKLLIFLTFRISPSKATSAVNLVHLSGLTQWQTDVTKYNVSVMEQMQDWS